MALRTFSRILLLCFILAVVAGGALAALRVMNQNEGGGPFADVLIPTLDGTPAKATPAPFLAKLVGTDHRNILIDALSLEETRGYVVQEGIHTVLVVPDDATFGMTAAMAFDGEASDAQYFAYKYTGEEGERKDAGILPVFNGQFLISPALLSATGDSYASLNTPGLDLERGERYYLRIIKQSPSGAPFDLSVDDPDRDRLNNQLEKGIGTDPKNPDSDGDGLSDGVERYLAGSALGVDGAFDPLNPDSNGDGVSDRTAFDALYDAQCGASAGVDGGDLCKYIPRISLFYGLDDDGCGNGVCDASDADDCPEECDVTTCECDANSDCLDGSECDGCMCVATPTCGNGACDPGEDNTSCPADCPDDGGGGGGGCEGGCQSDADCAEGDTCENCACIPGGGGGGGGGCEGGCQSDADCAEGDTCEECTCVPGGGGGGSCDDPPPPPNTCCPVCPDGESCVLSECVPDDGGGGDECADQCRDCSRFDFGEVVFSCQQLDAGCECVPNEQDCDPPCDSANGYACKCHTDGSGCACVEEGCTPACGEGTECTCPADGGSCQCVPNGG